MVQTNETQSKDRSKPYFEGDVIVDWSPTEADVTSAKRISKAEKLWANAFYRFRFAVETRHPDRDRFLNEYQTASDAYFQEKFKLKLHTQN